MYLPQILDAQPIGAGDFLIGYYVYVCGSYYYVSATRTFNEDGADESADYPFGADYDDPYGQ